MQNIREQRTIASFEYYISCFVIIKMDRSLCNTIVEEKEGTQTTIELIDVMKECSKNKDSLIGNGLTIEESVTYENIKDTLSPKCSPGGCISKYPSYTGLVGIILALCNSCLVFCLLPLHNILTQPNHWYEFMTISVFGFIGLFSAGFVLSCSVWMDLGFIKTWKNFFVVYSLSALTWLSLNTAYYIVWVIILEFNPPMPLNIHVCGILTLLIVMMSFWFILPTRLRSSQKFMKRYIYFCLAQIYRNACVWGYFFLARIFLIIDPGYQWTLAIILFIVRGFNGKVLTNLCYKAAACEKRIISITCQHEVGCRHAVFLCVALSLLASTSTSFLCLGFDFCINFIICVKILWDEKIKKRVIPVEQNMNLQELALNEKVVYIVPLTYCICFLMAYYGPNAGIIGNVKNTSWHFGMVEDISKPIFFMGVLFLIDLVSIMLWVVLLKVFTHLRFFDGYLQLQKDAWLIMAVQEAYALNEVTKF